MYLKESRDLKKEREVHSIDGKGGIGTAKEKKGGLMREQETFRW